MVHLAYPSGGAPQAMAMILASTGGMPIVDANPAARKGGASMTTPAGAPASTQPASSKASRPPASGARIAQGRAFNRAGFRGAESARRKR